MVWVGIKRDPDDTSATRTAFAFDDYGETDETAGRDTIILKMTQTGSDSSATGLIEVQVNGVGGLRGSLGLVQGEIVVCVVTREATTANIYINGDFTSSISVGSGVNRKWQFPRLGCHRYSGSNHEFGKQDHLVVAVRNTVWSQEQIRLFSNDPFGPFRMADDYAAWRQVATGGAASLTADQTIAAFASTAALEVLDELAADQTLPAFVSSGGLSTRSRLTASNTLADFVAAAALKVHAKLNGVPTIPAVTQSAAVEVIVSATGDSAVPDFLSAAVVGTVQRLTAAQQIADFASIGVLSNVSDPGIHGGIYPRWRRIGRR